MSNYITPYKRDDFFSVFEPFESLLTRWNKDRWIDGFGLNYDEKTQMYSSEIDVAGYKKNEISVNVEDNYVTITAKNDKRGTASRSFYLSDADPNTVEAKLEDGVLLVSVKKFPAKQPRQIEIT